MNVHLITLSLLVLSCGMSTGQELPSHVTSSQTDAILPATACATARGIAGVCRDRQFCDYSTYAIDLSLYAPKGYEKPCGDRDVCCPFGYQLTAESKNTRTEKDSNSDENITN